MRDFLRWTLEQVHPLAEALGYVEALTPLKKWQPGHPIPLMRCVCVYLKNWAIVMLFLYHYFKPGRRKRSPVKSDIERIVENYHSLKGDEAKFSDFLHRARDDARQDAEAPQRFRRRPVHTSSCAIPIKLAKL